MEMAGERALQCSLLVLLVLVPHMEAARQKRQVRYLPHGIQLPTAPRPARRNYDPPAQVTSVGGVHMFGEPLPGDNFSLPHQKSSPQMNSFEPRLLQLARERFKAHAMTELPYRAPNEHDLAEPLVARQALGPPPPRVNLSQLAQMPALRAGPLGSGHPAYGFPPPGPLDLTGLPQSGRSLGLHQMFKDRPANPYHGLAVPTAMGPYQRRLKTTESQPPLSVLRDSDDPKKNTKKVTAPYDTWQGAQEGALVTPPSAEQLAPLAPPRWPERTVRPRKSKNEDQEYSLDLLRHIPPFDELPEHSASTRWRYRYALGSAEESSAAAPALLGADEGLAGEHPESDVSFSDSVKPAKPQPSNTTFDYILL